MLTLVILAAIAAAAIYAYVHRTFVLKEVAQIEAAAKAEVAKIAAGIHIPQGS